MAEDRLTGTNNSQPGPSADQEPTPNPRPTEPQPQTALGLISVIAGWVGVAALLGAGVWWTVSKSLFIGPLVILIAGATLSAFWLIVNFAILRERLTTRRGQQIINSTAFALLVLGILILVNYMGVRHHIRKDLTETKQYSLAEQTRKIAKSLDQDVELLAFISPQSFGYEMISDRLREYEMLSPRIKLHCYDPQTNFDMVKKYDIQAEGTIIVKSGERTEKVTGATEEQITSAILAVTTGEKTKVYFLTGHGERVLERGGPDGIGTVRRSLENQQYDVQTLSMVTMQEPQVPGDCAALIIAGPRHPLHEKEIKAIKDYINRGGKLFIAVDPPPAPNLHQILAEHGVEPLDGVVIDPRRGFWGQAQVPVVTNPPYHEITYNIEAIALPDTRAFEVASAPPQGYPGAPPPPQSAKSLLESSDDAWLETQPTGTVKKDPDERGGPLTLAAVVDESQSPRRGMPPGTPQSAQGTRMVVVGTSLLMTDRLVNAGLIGGAHLVLKSIAWMLENEKLVSIPPKQQTRTFVTLSDIQRKLAMVFVLGVVPLLVIVSGGLVWWIRRRG